MSRTKKGEEYDNIVQSYFDAVCGDERPYGDAIDILNKRLSQGYPHLKFYAWRSGTRSIPKEVEHFMREYCLAEEIRRAGGEPPETEEAVRQLNDRLSPPIRKHKAVEKAKKRRRALNSRKHVPDTAYQKGPYSRETIHALADATDRYLQEQGMSASRFLREHGLTANAISYLRHHDERVEQGVPTVSVRLIEAIADAIGFNLEGPGEN